MWTHGDSHAAQKITADAGRRDTRRPTVAGLLLTTEVMIAEAPKDDEHAHGGSAPGCMDM
jgi:hypothetical protein